MAKMTNGRTAAGMFNNDNIELSDSFLSKGSAGTWRSQRSFIHGHTGWNVERPDRPSGGGQRELEWQPLHA